MDDLTQSALSPDRAAAVRHAARDTVREWLRLPDPRAAVAMIGAIGTAAIQTAADEARRLSAIPQPPEDVTAALGALRSLAETAAQPRPRRRPFARRAASVDLATALPPVVRQLEHARDALLRHRVRLAAQKDRLSGADAALEDAAHHLKALIATAAAAGREIASSDPASAATLRGAITDALHGRLQDILNQLAVTRQGRLSLVIVEDADAALVDALGRARTTTVAALNTATAAAAALTHAQHVSDQVVALEQVTATSSAPDGAASARALAEAVAGVDAAIRALPAEPLDSRRSIP